MRKVEIICDMVDCIYWTGEREEGEIVDGSCSKESIRITGMMVHFEHGECLEFREEFILKNLKKERK